MCAFLVRVCFLRVVTFRSNIHAHTQPTNHTHIHTYTHTHIHTYTHTHTHIHTYTHTHTHTYTNGFNTGDGLS